MSLSGIGTWDYLIFISRLIKLGVGKILISEIRNNFIGEDNIYNVCILIKIDNFHKNNLNNLNNLIDNFSSRGVTKIIIKILLILVPIMNLIPQKFQ